MKNTILPKIDLLKSHLEQITKTERKRTYMGMSQFGNDCDRALYYIAANAILTKNNSLEIIGHLEARQARIFRMGNKIEKLVVKDLKKAGVKFESKQGSYSHCNGLIKGHSDGVVTNIPTAPKTRHLLEVKSMADKYFKAYKKAGSMEKYNKQYWIQANLYAFEEKCSRILFVVENKNDQARHYERAHVDNKLAEFYLKRGVGILQLAFNGEELPERLNETPHKFPCNWCNFREQCHD